MPQGVQVLPIYDRSDLIRRSISNARSTLIEVILTVVIIILIFLWHFPSAVIPVVTIPVAILLTFIPLQYPGVSINIMSLAGLAIACGELVDAAIVVVEQTHKKLEIFERSGQPFKYDEVILEAVREVAGSDVLCAAGNRGGVPASTRARRSGRQAVPTAGLYEKFRHAGGGRTALTLDPALRLLMVRSPNALADTESRAAIVQLASGRQDSPRREASDYRTADSDLRSDCSMDASLENAGDRRSGALLVLLTIPLFWKIGSEFMPPLEEGSLLYMPTTMPGISIAEAQRLACRSTDGILKSFPEVDHVLGKTGRADTATDPAPLSMLETDRRSEASFAVAKSACMVLVVGSQLGSSRAAAYYPRPYLGAGTGRGDE